MSIFDLIFGKRQKSANEAKQRLMMVLEYERKKLPPNFAELLKQDLITVFSKYEQFDISNIEVNVKKSHNTEELWISIPFRH